MRTRTLLKNVTKSLEEYMRDNVSENNARDYLAQQYPDALKVDTSGGAPKLMPSRRRARRSHAGLHEGPRSAAARRLLDQDTIEQTLVPAARQRMALDRQHLLATMVLMGINRLVVTDGDIDAKVLFQLDSVDKVDRRARRRRRTSPTPTRRRTRSSAGGSARRRAGRDDELHRRDDKERVARRPRSTCTRSCRAR